AEERLAIVLAEWFDGRAAAGGDRGETGAADAEGDRVAALGLHHLALRHERDPAWRAAWRERLVLATAWAHAAPDTFAEATTLAYLASTALLEATDAGRAARVLDPFVDDPRLEHAKGEARLLERRACAARMTGDAARALELLERAKAVLADGEAEWMRYLLAEEFRVLMSIGLTDRAARVLDRQEALRDSADESTPAGRLARRVAIGNRIRWTYARSRHRQVIADAEHLLATLPDDGEHPTVPALL